MRTVQATSRGEDLARIVRELLVAYVDPRDVPGDHRCSPGCSHGEAPGLLVRLRAMLAKGTPLERGSSARPGVRGPRASPSPWTAPVAELLLEVQQRAVDLDAELRAELGFGPLTVPVVVTDDPPPGVVGWVPRRPRVVRVPAASCGRRGAVAALRTLPDLLEDHAALAEDGSWLSEQMERELRSWHHRALLLTGHDVEWPRLTDVPNPDHLATYDDAPGGLDRAPFLRGPACERCEHDTCRRLRRSRLHPSVRARCPWCGSISLRQNPLSGAIQCVRPSCRDEEGRPHVWPLDELRRLGVLIWSDR